MFSFLAFKSLREQDGCLVSPVYTQCVWQPQEFPWGIRYAAVEPYDLANGRGIHAATWKEAKKYAQSMYLVAPIPTLPVIEGEQGWRAQGAFIVEGPLNDKDVYRAARLIVAADQAGYPQIDGILRWAQDVVFAIEKIRPWMETSDPLPSEWIDFRIPEEVTREGENPFVMIFAARHGRLPAGFDRWELATPSGWSVAHEAIYYGHIPTDFDRWEIATPSGLSVAHIGALRGTLPADFDRWEITDSNGITAAHVAARYNHLPAGFNRWELATPKGWMVAHEAAYYDHLPADFDRWDLATPQGWTVAQIAAQITRKTA